MSTKLSEAFSHRDGQPQRILVTGGCGFVGHHFVEHVLKETDWEIEIIDKLSYSGDAAKVTELSVFDPDRVRLHWHDLRAPIMESLANEVGHIDYIVNFASESHVDNSIDQPVDFILNNVGLAVNILEFSRRAQVKKFIQISTDEVFGPAPNGIAFSEWTKHLPSNPYSASKSAQESIAISYWRTYGIPLFITNTMNMFGERQHVEKLIPKAIKCFLDGEPVPVHAQQIDGVWTPSSRFWLHARNHADALLWILREVEPDAYPESEHPTKFNISGDIELSALEIVQRIAEIMGVEADVEFVDYHSHRPGHDMRYALDGSKIHRRGWNPPVDFHKSLEHTVNWTVDHKDRWL
jgi:dTDP-glucose 4,6-dehydratase